MKRILELMVLVPAAGFALPVLVDSALKGVVLLAVILAAVMLLRTSSAALRHLVLMAAMVGLLVLPVLSVTLPGWRVLPAWAQPSVTASETTAPDTVTTEGVVGSDFAGAKSSGVVAPGVSAEMAATPTENRWAVLAVWAWFAGGCLLGLWLALSQWALWRLGRTAKISQDETQLALLDELKSRMKVRRRVQLLLHQNRAMPMTWGIFKTRLLLPEDSTNWSADRLQAVLLHELAHVKRRDCLTQLLTQAVCAVHWFNPLVWIAARRMAAERELACDDLVLNSGIRASDYAEHLLRIATGYEDQPTCAAGALAMARKSRLEGRLTSILSDHTNRRSITRRAAAAVVAGFAMLALPVAMMRAVADEPADSEEQTLEKLAAEWASEVADEKVEEPLVGIDLIDSLHGDETKFTLESPKTIVFPSGNVITTAESPGVIYVPSQPRPSRTIYLDGGNSVDPARQQNLAGMDPLLVSERSVIGTETLQMQDLNYGDWLVEPRKVFAAGTFVDPWGKKYTVKTEGDPVGKFYPLKYSDYSSYMEAKEQLDVLKVKQAEVSIAYGARHPNILALSKQIAHLEDIIAKQEKQPDGGDAPAVDDRAIRLQDKIAELGECLESGFGKRHPKVLQLQREIRELQPAEKKLTGIGIIFHKDDTGFTVMDLLKGGPAERSKKIERGDKIKAFAEGKDGKFVPVDNLGMAELVTHLRGKPGSTVQLLIDRGGKGGIKVAIVREVLDVSAHPPMNQQAKEPQPVLLKLNQIDAVEAKEAIDDLLDKTKRGRLVTDVETNSLIYIGDTETLDLVRKVLEWLDTPTDK